MRQQRNAVWSGSAAGWRKLQAARAPSPAEGAPLTKPKKPKKPKPPDLRKVTKQETKDARKKKYDLKLAEYEELMKLHVKAARKYRYKIQAAAAKRRRDVDPEVLRRREEQAEPPPHAPPPRGLRARRSRCLLLLTPCRACRVRPAGGQEPSARRGEGAGGQHQAPAR